MNSSVKLSLPKFPKMMSLLIHSNQFLKMFSVASLAVNLLMGLIVLSALGREPMVVTISEKGLPLATAEEVKVEDQIKFAIGQYIAARYSWTPQSVKEQLGQAKAFIMTKNGKAFENASLGIQKFSAERSVTQRIYPSKIEINLQKSTASVRGDRVTSIQGLKAAGDLKLELTFENGARTKENPWGIYITKEKEE
jgi:hypothetical protein